MPKITDTLFSLVLARMNLTRLVLTSEKPLTKVVTVIRTHLIIHIKLVIIFTNVFLFSLQITKLGIDALLKGDEFRESIEKFPFIGWSLADIPAQEFQKLGQQFRSSQMM